MAKFQTGNNSTNNNKRVDISVDNTLARSAMLRVNEANKTEKSVTDTL